MTLIPEPNNAACLPSPRLPPSNETLFERIACAIEQRGYAILPAALPQAIADGLVNHLSQIEAAHFHPAAIGRGLVQTRNQFVRRDKIFWIEEQMPQSQRWLNWTQAMRRYLNSRLFLGLFTFESHFAVYETGDFYKKHRDAFVGESNRVLSLVTYLNKGWTSDQGGELLIYAPDEHTELIKVVPNFGTLVVFLSEEFPHEVLPAQRERFSVAGWFRLNNSINGQLDPPR